MKNLYEIIVPTKYGDTLKPIKTKHHKKWDALVQAITGGLTILSPAKGKWIYKGVEYPEKVIPVRIMCDSNDIKKIIAITLSHYRQKAVMCSTLSTDSKLYYIEDVQ